ncbi:MAG: NAD-dependent protein deacylase [Oscillospiraceae bacterium]|nr:NAD-dependent protein deacylase [Oscillospiraceae bacterium]
MQNWAERLKDYLSGGGAVFFGGAGVSTESGIPDFRGKDGLYNQKYKFPPERMLSRTFFNENTKDFYDFYREKMIFPDVRPNKAHFKLAELEKAGGLNAVITQNIDGLHQKAGSVNVVELHGSVHRNLCMECGAAHDIGAVINAAGVPRCECGGVIKPDVVLYEEQLDYNVTIKAKRLISEADVLIVGGTSLAVYPAAGFIDYYTGGKLVLINKSETPYDGKADLVIRESIGEVLASVIP